MTKLIYDPTKPDPIDNNKTIVMILIILPFLSIQNPALGEIILIILYPSRGKIGSKLKAARAILIITKVSQNWSTKSPPWRTAYALPIPIIFPYIIAIVIPMVAKMKFIKGHAIAVRKSSLTGLRK